MSEGIHFDTIPLENTTEKIEISFDRDSNIHAKLKDYSDKRIKDYTPSDGIDSLLDARGQTLKLWYEKNPTTNELLWSIGIDGLDEDKKIKTKTILFNQSVLAKFMKIGMDYFFTDIPANMDSLIIENILNMKNGFGLAKYLIKHKVITQKNYCKEFNTNQQAGRKQLRTFTEVGLVKVYGNRKGQIYKLHIKEEDIRSVISTLF